MTSAAPSTRATCFPRLFCFLSCLSLALAAHSIAFAQNETSVIKTASADRYYVPSGPGPITANRLQVEGRANNEFASFMALDFTVSANEFGPNLSALGRLALTLSKVDGSFVRGRQVVVFLATDNTRSLTTPATAFTPSIEPLGLNSTDGPFGRLVKLGVSSIGKASTGTKDNIGFHLPAAASDLLVSQIRRDGKVRLILAPNGPDVALVWTSSTGAVAARPTLTLTSSAAFAPPDAAAMSIVGSWLIGDAGKADSAASITFLSDGRYIMIQDGDVNDPTERDGFERGTYTWSATTGAFTALAATDTNAAYGIHNFNIRVAVTDTTLTLLLPNENVVLNRVTSTTNALIGGWTLDDESEEDGLFAACLTFLPTGHYLFAQDSIPDPDGSGIGIERGTYTWNTTTGVFTAQAQLDTGGDGGLSGNPRVITIAGDTLTTREPGPEDDTFTLKRVAASSSQARLVNLSLRTDVGGAAGTLTVGFVISGTGSKPMLLRGIGPALAGFNVPDFLPDPMLALFRGSSGIATNDNWDGNAQIASVGTQVGAFQLTNPASRDAALYQPALQPGNYSVQLSGVGNATGVALTELYDGTPAQELTAQAPRLVNVSVLTQLTPTGGPLLAGFVIGGTGTKTVLIRAVGPGLATFGVTDAIADPKLALNGWIFADANDDWGGGATLADAFTAAGAFGLPSASKDAALLVTLRPGPYTVQISSTGTTGGSVLVEVYEMR